MADTKSFEGGSDQMIVEEYNDHMGGGSEHCLSVGGKSKNTTATTSHHGKYAPGRWTDLEHEKFLEGVQLYGKDWNKVHDHIGSRTNA